MPHKRNPLRVGNLTENTGGGTALDYRTRRGLPSQGRAGRWRTRGPQRCGFTGANMARSGSAVAGVRLSDREILMGHAAETVTAGRYTDAALVHLGGAPDELFSLRRGKRSLPQVTLRTRLATRCRMWIK